MLVGIKPQLCINNIYDKLPLTKLRDLFRERDTRPPDDRKAYAAYLNSLDLISPSWRDEAVNSQNLTRLSTLQMLYRVLYIMPSLPWKVVEPICDSRKLLTRVILPSSTPMATLEVEAARVLCVGHGYVTGDDVEFLSHLELISTYREKKLSTKNSTVLVERRQRHLRIERCPNKDLIHSLYGGDTTPFFLRTKHVLEDYIVSLPNGDLTPLATVCGMIVPRGVNINDYVRRNIADYRLLFERDKQRQITPALYTDAEIFNWIGVYITYSSRANLLEKVERIATVPTFLLPLSNTSSKCTNTETTAGTSTSDTNAFFIGYGTKNKYTLYEVDELCVSFRRDDDTGLIEFRRPENQDAIFVIEDVRCLLELLTVCQDKPHVQELILQIDEGIIAYESVGPSMRDKVREFKMFTKGDRDSVLYIITNLFDMGMYMRRWKGPGHPYPISEAQTKINEIPDYVVSRYIKILQEKEKIAPKIFSFVIGLDIGRYNRSGNFIAAEIPLRRKWTGVVSGSECIRVASYYFVTFAFHYHHLFFGKNIADIDITALEKIC